MLTLALAGLLLAGSPAGPLLVTVDDSPGGLTLGRKELLERYRRRYPGPEAMGTLALEVLDMRTASGTELSLLGDAVPSRVHAVSVVARWRLARPGNEDATGLTLIALRPRGERWEIVQDASVADASSGRGQVDGAAGRPPAAPGGGTRP